MSYENPLDDRDTPTDQKPRRKKPRYVLWSILGTVILIIVIGVLCDRVFFPNSVTSDGNRKQRELNSLTTDAFGAMHTCEVNTARAAQIAGAQTDAVDRVLKDAISGRYGTGANLDQNKVFSLLQEAYPDLTGLNATFQDAMIVMTGCQKDFLAKQSRMNKAAQALESWTDGSWFTRTYGGDKFPNEGLHVTLGARKHTAQDALDIMQRAVLSSDNINALETGVDESASEDPFNTPAPTTTSK